MIKEKYDDHINKAHAEFIIDMKESILKELTSLEFLYYLDIDKNKKYKDSNDLLLASEQNYVGLNHSKQFVIRMFFKNKIGMTFIADLDINSMWMFLLHPNHENLEYTLENGWEIGSKKIIDGYEKTFNRKVKKLTTEWKREFAKTENPEFNEFGFFESRLKKFEKFRRV